MVHNRLSPLDASFLYLDSPHTPMHISSLAVYEGDPPSELELSTHLGRRLHHVPRFRQRLATVPLNGHRPVWVDDDRFDIGAHLERTALPAIGTDNKLLQTAGRILSQPLSRRRPLWEMWLIEGLTGNRFALLSKTHHSLMDGVSGVDLHSALLDATPDAQIDPPPQHRPGRRPGPLDLVRRAVRDRVEEATHTLGGLLHATRSPREAIRNAGELAAGTAALAGSLLRQAPRSPLNGRVGPRRSFATAHTSFDDLRKVKDTLGATVNDVILTVVAGALRRWQIGREVAPHDVRVMVPVSVRRPDDEPGGNRVVMLVVWIPVSERDPVMRLERVHQTMERAKRSSQVAAGETMVRLSGFLPPQAIAGLSRFQYTRSFNLVVTNIPGPQFPLYLQGRRLVQLIGQAPLAAGQRLSIAALSYDGKMDFGLLADPDAVGDVGVISRGIEDSFAELVAETGVSYPEPDFEFEAGGVAAEIGRVAARMPALTGAH